MFRILLTLVLFISKASAGTVEMIFNVNGPSCRHIEIRDAATHEVLEVTTEDELKSPITGNETFLLYKIKSHLIVNGTTTNQDIGSVLPQLVVTDFDLKPLKPKLGTK